MQLTMLGTGNAAVTRCYNTCFVLRDGENNFLVDGGGGNGLLRQLELADIDWRTLRTIFVTHRHIDHIMGVAWMMRKLCQAMCQGDISGEAVIYAHQELTGLLHQMAQILLAKKHAAMIGPRLHIVPVEDGETLDILGRPTTFFDIHSNKDQQFGFSMELEPGKKLTCCGDEPCHAQSEDYARGSSWLLHEAFCLHSQAEVFKPYEKYHSTVKDACELAQRLEVENLLLYHTEDKNLDKRKELYLAEGKAYFRGNLYVPDDLETLTL
ncbi:MAG: MBL fold metallo-hydrolase [Clostridiales bacterium]|nr:MBL fold metallo-hydrolase [Clostridiales bacterium]